MKRFAWLAVAGSLVLAVAVAGTEVPADMPMTPGLNADALAWGPAPPALPAGGRLAVLAGDPGAAGPFTIRLSAPDGYKVMPHTHPSAEHVTVISGTFHVGTGPTFDPAAAQTLHPGGFIALPAGMPHFAWAEGEVVVQVHGEGPFTLTYVDPADDPRNAAPTE